LVFASRPFVSFSYGKSLFFTKSILTGPMHILTGPEEECTKLLLFTQGKAKCSWSESVVILRKDSGSGRFSEAWGDGYVWFVHQHWDCPLIDR
jgi:hypothetical protein